MSQQDEQASLPPLQGLKVVDLTHFYAGPLATSWLGDMGADVIKVEKPPIGDPTRKTDRLLENGRSSYFSGLNRSKRSIMLDLSTSKGLNVLRRLVERADVLVENFRPGVMDRLGLSYEEAKAINPKLIYCSINSFGDKGPLSEKPGMDLVVQAMGGVMGITGLEGGQPVRVGAPVADYVGALQTMTTVLLALNERHRSGKGQRVNVILLDGQIAMLSNYIAGFFVSGRPSGPVGIFHPQIVPYQPYDAKDRQVIVACLTEQFWQRMCQALDLEFLLDDARFDLVADRVAHREELNGILKPVFAAMTSAELIQRLEEADVPCCPINSISDIVDHPQVKANGTILELEYDGGSHHAVKAPFGLSRTPPRKPTAGPALGEHTEEILNEIGLSSADL